MSDRVFISYASEDRIAFVRPLVEELKTLLPTIWFDEYEIRPGMSIRESIDKGLADSGVGVLILSQNYFLKKWTALELNALFQKLTFSKTKLIPIWYNITYPEIIKVSPLMADILAIQAHADFKALAQEIYKAIYSYDPILKITRDYLDVMGFSPPEFYDDWWVNVFEFWGVNTFQIPWSLPINPVMNHTTASVEDTKSYKLAWAALRYNWIILSRRNAFNQFSDPVKLIQYITNTPGMLTICRYNIDYLALYAPQLLFYESILTPLFLRYYNFSKQGIAQLKIEPEFRSPIINLGKLPICKRNFAMIDEAFGNFKPEALLMHFIEGELLGPEASNLNYWSVLILLCSSMSRIYPSKVVSILLAGFQSEHAVKKLIESLDSPSRDSFQQILQNDEQLIQLISETCSYYRLELEDDIARIASIIQALNLQLVEITNRSERLTIPPRDIELRFRGLSYQQQFLFGASFYPLSASDDVTPFKNRILLRYLPSYSELLI